MTGLVLPILVPLSTAAVLMLAPRRPDAQRWIAMAGSVLLLASTIAVFTRVEADGVQVLQIGGWAAPFGIVVVVDLLAGVMLVLGATTALASLVYGYAELPVSDEHPLRLPLVQFLVTGVLGPNSNAHGPNEFLHLDYARRITLCAARVLAGHGARRTTKAAA